MFWDSKRYTLAEQMAYVTAWMDEGLAADYFEKNAAFLAAVNGYFSSLR